MRAILLFAALLMAVSPALAQNWDETGDGGGDAGDLPSSAQAVGAGPYTSITGEHTDAADLDTYLIHIGDPSLFSATTCDAATTHGDTTLELLNLDGSGTARNDDDPGCALNGFLSTLPAGDPLYAGLPAGLFYLRVGKFANDLLDAGGNPIFDPACAFADICAPVDGDPVASHDGGGSATGLYTVVFGDFVTPVELVAFTGVATSLSVTLSWETASETNNSGFEVQMQNGEGWDVLSFVEGHGTTTEAQTYSYSAEGMGVGTHVFRLKQIDFDGAFEYSGEIEVTIETPGTHLISNAYPNPFNPQSQFTLAVAQDQVVTAELFNTLGQRVAVLFDGSVEANQPQLVTIDGAGLASGMYVVRVTGERFADALSVTLLK